MDLIRIVIYGREDLLKAITEALDCLIATVTSNARMTQRGSSIVSIIRVGNTLWKSFALRMPGIMEIEYDPKDYPDLKDLYVNRLSKTDPELFLLCFEQNVFLGYVLTPTDQERMKKARLTLKTDRQPRLALRLYQALNEKR